MKSSADENGDFDDVRDDKVDIEMARLLIFIFIIIIMIKYYHNIDLADLACSYLL